MAETPIIYQFSNGLQEIDGQVTPAFGATSGTIVEGNDNRLSAQQVLIVKKDPGAGEFSSIKAAVDSITDATASKPYQIFVRAGVYVEDTIIMKPYVNIRGIRNSTIIEIDDPSKDLIVGTYNSEVCECTLRGATNAGKALIRVSSTAAGDVFTVRDCLFGDASSFVILNSATLSQVTLIACLSLTTANTDVAFKASGVGYNILNIIGFSGSVPAGKTLSKWLEASGSNTTVVVHCCGVMSAGGVLNTALEAYNGASLNVNSSAVLGAVVGLSVPNIGAGPTLRVANLTLNSVSYDVNMEHPSAVGFLSGAWDHSKELIEPLSTVSVFHSDPTPGTGVAILGDIIQGEDQSKTINFTKLSRESATVGLVSGGELSLGDPLEINVSAGEGFLDDQDGVVQQISWGSTTLVFQPHEDMYIVVNENGVVTTTANVPSLSRVILLGRVRSQGSDICFIEPSVLKINHWGNRIEALLRRALGPLFVSGCSVNENSTPLHLDVTSGEFHFGSKAYHPSGGSDITFTTKYRDGVGGWVSVPSQTAVDNLKYDDGSGTLQDIGLGKFVKHALYIVGEGATEEYHVLYGQTQFDSEGEAVAGTVPTPPPFFKDGVSIIASIIAQEGSSNIVSILDERPRLGFASSSAQSSNDHGSLLGLSDDDHTQYLLADGSRALSGNLDLGDNAITNTSSVNGVVVESHSARHLPNGSDPLTTAIAIGIDGDSSNTIGIQNSLARSDHSHSIATGVVTTQTPDSANAEGTSASLARSDHTHNIPADAPNTSLSANTTNQEGVALSFSRSDHTHDILTGVASTQGPDQFNAEGSSPNLARADHVHNIPTGAPSAITPDGGNAEGTSSEFARADHVHDLPAAAPTTSLSGDTTNTEGSAESVARSDHVHEITTGTVSTQTPDQPNAEGTSSSLARADHTHNLPTETAQTVGTVNTEGTANSFSRSDHVHSHGDQGGGALHAVATQSVHGFMSSTDKFLLDQIMKIKTIMQEETGFANSNDSEVSFDDVTKTLTIQPKAPATSYSYWINGTEYVKSSPESIAISEAVNSGEGIHFFYFDGATLVTDHEPPNVSVIRDVAFVFLIYWDSTNQRHIRFQEERHRFMPHPVHDYLHYIEGTRFVNGLGLSAFTLGTGDSDADVQFACADGEIRDEDIPHVITNGAPQTLAPVAEIPIFYKLGTNGYFRRKDSNAYPLIYSGAGGYSGPNGRIPWNRDTGAGWVLQEASEGYVVPVFYFATGDKEEAIMGIQGESQYQTVDAARDGAVSELLVIWQRLKGLSKEFTPVGINLYQTSSAYTNTVKARLVPSPGGDTYIDVRGLQISDGGSTSGVASNDHGSLAGLTDDDHQQYLNRSGIRPMTGNLNMDGHNIVTGSGTVDGVDVSNHKNRHLPAGSDPVDTAAPTTNLTGDTTNQTGTANSLSRSDHVHAIDTDTPTTLLPDQANSEGTSASLARADHVHEIPANVPSQQLADAANAEGIATSFSRADHIHNIPTAVAVTLLPDIGNQQGTSSSFAKADHIHDVPCAAPVNVGVANSEGTANSFARSDHVHNHGQQTQDNLHALVTRTTHGFLSATDKVKIDELARGVIQGSNPAQQTYTTTSWVSMPLDTDRSSYPNSLLTKVSSTDFRADFSGAVEVSFKVQAWPTDNDRGYAVAVFKNGNILPHTYTQGNGKNVPNRANTVSMSFVDNCTANDVYTLRLNSIDGSTITVPIDYAFMSVKVYRVSL